VTAVPPVAADMAAFDALPARLRRAVAGAPYPPDARALGELIFGLRLAGYSQAAAVEMVLHALPAAEADNLARFAAAYERRHGAPYPHLAAGATLLRG
jgi:hypothetical protein